MESGVMALRSCCNLDISDRYGVSEAADIDTSLGKRSGIGCS